MLGNAFSAIVLFTLIFAPAGWAAYSAKAAEAEQSNNRSKQCTAEQGQLLINEGSYERAVLEFTCVFNSQPTEVEGYRGRKEAELWGLNTPRIYAILASAYLA